MENPVSSEQSDPIDKTFFENGGEANKGGEGN